MKSNYEKIFEKLELECRVQEVDWNKVSEVNERMEEVHREYLIGEAKSWESASKVYFTA